MSVILHRDTTEEVRIKKTVDAWIKALSKDIQVRLSQGHTIFNRYWFDSILIIQIQLYCSGGINVTNISYTMSSF